LIRVAEASSRFPKKGVTNIEAVETRVLNSLNQTTAYATSLKVIFAYIATVGFASFTACMPGWPCFLLRTQMTVRSYAQEIDCFHAPSSARDFFVQIPDGIDSCVDDQ
jgi:hypothetical protein